MRLWRLYLLAFVVMVLSYWFGSKENEDAGM